MNFDLTDTQKEMKKDLIHWLKEESQGFIPAVQGDLKGQNEQLRSFLQKLGRRDGYLQTGLNQGETKQSPFSEALTWIFLAEELARFSPSLFVTIETSTRLFGWFISRYGNEPYPQELLIPLQKGMLLGAMAMAESSRNFPEKEIKTLGQKEGNFFRLNGQKKQVINAPLADWLAVTGKVDGQWVVFLIKSDQEGLSVSEPQRTLGFNGMVVADITLNQCLVPEDRVIGPFPDPKFLDELQTRLNLIVTTASLGVMDRALQNAKKYAAEKQDSSKPLRAYQTISFKLAEMFTLFQTSQWMIYRTAWMLEGNVAGADTMADATKVFVSEAAETVAKEAMQIMAGEGFLAGNIAEECFRDARFGPVSGDTSEVLRMRIADDCLAKYRT
jgi:alkylation response protein AidB-like acyl-CoA dehydrogenase